MFWGRVCDNQRYTSPVCKTHSDVTRLRVFRTAHIKKPEKPKRFPSRYKHNAYLWTKRSELTLSELTCPRFKRTQRSLSQPPGSRPNILRGNSPANRRQPSASSQKHITQRVKTEFCHASNIITLTPCNCKRVQKFCYRIFCRFSKYFYALLTNRSKKCIISFNTGHTMFFQTAARC